MKANHKRQWVEITVGRSIVEVEVFPGQFIFGRHSAAKELSMNPETVRKRMQKLKNLKNLTINSTRQYSVVTIVNWDSYQAESEKSTSKDTNRVPTEYQPGTTDNNDKNDNNNIYCRAVAYLNRKTKQSYKPTTKKTQALIKARLNEGFTADDFKLVIDHQCKEWLGDDKMFKFLRPETLFGTKFESYLNAAKLNGSAQPSESLTEDEIRQKYGVA